MNKNLSGAERRKAKRRPILESFSLFVVIPKKGSHRLPVHDVSDLGMRFDVEFEGEEATVATGETIDLQLYLNQGLYLPLSLQVVRLEKTDTGRRVGAEFRDHNSKSYQAFQGFLKMVDGIIEEARLHTTA